MGEHVTLLEFCDHHELCFETPLALHTVVQSIGEPFPPQFELPDEVPLLVVGEGQPKLSAYCQLDGNLTTPHHTSNF